MNYINNVPIASGEITIVTSDHAEATMRHSAQLAFDAKKNGLNVLLVNCGMSDKRFRTHVHDTFGKEIYHGTRMIIHTSSCGDLIGERDAIDNIVDQARIGAIILCGWEFASCTRRRKERLICYLRELMANDGVSVTIYCHTANAPVAGKLDKGGIGKLGLLAWQVCEINSSELLEPILKRPDPVIATPGEMREAEQSVQMLLNKVNELAGDGQKILRSHEAPPRMTAPKQKERPSYTSFDDEEGIGGALVAA